MMLTDVGDQSEAIVQATETSNRSAPSDKDVLKQNIPVWAAYNSLFTSTNTTKHELSLDAVHALPLINSPAHEWKTLVTSLMQLHKLNLLTRGPDSTWHVCVWLEMDLYKRVLKLTNPDVWHEFENGGFTVNTNLVPFTAIGVGQAQEHVNKVHKGHGGITHSPEALLGCCLSTPVLERKGCGWIT